MANVIFILHSFSDTERILDWQNLVEKRRERELNPGLRGTEPSTRAPPEPMLVEFLSHRLKLNGNFWQAIFFQFFVR